MPADSVTCPYCNAILAADAAPTRGEAACPRCGEILPAHLAQAIQARPASSAMPLSGGAVPEPPLVKPPSHASIRRVAGIVVGIMGVMAILSFTYAWHTVTWRRSRDPKPPRTIAMPRAAVEPIELAALGYLPPSTDIIAALYVAEAGKTPRGKDFLQPVRIGTIPVSPADLEGWTGLKLDEIDHAVLGLKVEPRLTPFVLVVQARQPVDEMRIRKAIKAERSSDVGKKKAWHFTVRVGAMSPKAFLWLAAPETLVIALDRAELEKVPAQPAKSGKHLAGPLREVITERINPGAQAWLAGHVENWEPVLRLLGFIIDEENLQTLTSLRTFGVGVRFDAGLRLEGRAKGVDEAATRRLETRWAIMEVPESSTELGPMIRELAQSYTRAVKDGWLTITAEARGQTGARAGPP
jgi:hypothetical protein